MSSTFDLFNKPLCWKTDVLQAFETKMSTEFFVSNYGFALLLELSSCCTGEQIQLENISILKQKGLCKRIYANWRSIFLYISYFYSACLQVLHRIKRTLQYLLVCKGVQFNVNSFLMRRSHLLPEQLLGEHAGDTAAILAFLLQDTNLGKHTLFLH